MPRAFTPSLTAAASAVAGRVGEAELDADEEPAAADVADQRVLDRAQPVAAAASPRSRACACSRSSLDHVEHREPDLGRHRVAAERVEVLHPGHERGGDLRRRDDRAERVAVADRLAHRDDVGHDAVGSKPQKCVADAAEADLHLVGDAHAAGGAHVRERRREVAVAGRRSGRRSPAATRRRTRPARVRVADASAYARRRRRSARGTGRQRRDVRARGPPAAARRG